MRYYPINLDLRARACLVVGGGAVGTRKVLRLLDCGARVTVVSPEASEALERLAAEGRIRLARRPYAGVDLHGMCLVIGAAGDGEVNRRIRRDARRHGVMVNIVDQPAASDFILPAVVARGDLIIGVSTSGSSPALAKRLRRELEGQFGDEYARLLQLLGAVRRRLLRAGHDPDGHRRCFETLLDGRLLEWLRAGDLTAIDRHLAETLGDGWDYASLMAETDATATTT
jgi:precorrin-2 dehydrogenase/sirohydrochlorin ferrochelatase